MNYDTKKGEEIIETLNKAKSYDQMTRLISDRYFPVRVYKPDIAQGYSMRIYK